MSISYNKQVWKPTDEFTETTANKWENGIKDAVDGVNSLNSNLGDYGNDRLNGFNISENGSINADSNFDLLISSVQSGEVISAKDGYVYAFYTSKPQSLSVSYDNKRVVEGLENVTVPNGVSWVAVRVQNGIQSKVEHRDFTLNTNESIAAQNESLVGIINSLPANIISGSGNVSGMSYSNGTITSNSTDTRAFCLRLFLGTSSNSQAVEIYGRDYFEKGKFKLKFKPTSNYTILRVKHNGATIDLYADLKVELVANKEYIITFNCVNNDTSTSGGIVISDIVVCCADFGEEIPKYVPYTGTSGRLNEDVSKLKNDLSSLGYEIAFGDVDFNNLTNKMVYAINGTCTNAPKTTPIHGILIVFKASNDIISQLYHDSDGTLYNRMYWGGTWGSWK